MGTMNIPNSLTILRVVAIPGFIVAMAYNYHGLAFVIFLACGLTDALDGLIARTFHQQTEFGAFMDPLADKLLMTSTFITLALVDGLNTIPLWLIVVAISRDVIIPVGIAVLFMLGIKLKIAPTWIGKVTTFCQISLIMIVLFCNYTGRYVPRLVLGMSWVTLMVSVISGLDYVFRGIQFLNTTPPSAQNV
jgi:cardiolipin synthase (CMP-forming)